jgi:predicted CoA-substrate-specific enzyme activase
VSEADPRGLFVGLDVGSTTVKFVVVDPADGTVLMKDYRRHETRQPETCLDMLRAIRTRFADLPDEALRVFVTGSGGTAVGRHLGARFVQEVNAVSLAVEKLYPDAQSVIELGGQDAKIIVFKTDEAAGRKRKIPSMNDKCAGGTGAVIDKISAKVRVDAGGLANLGYLGLKLHPVAGKCGVFAETDINGLQKQGVPPDELMASLFESIIQQNLAVLSRGHTLRPQVLLLGGPNCFIRGMREGWRHHLPLIWKERGVPYDAVRPIEELIVVPDDAEYFAAIGAVEFGGRETLDHPDLGVFHGTAALERYLTEGRSQEKRRAGRRGLWTTPDELQRFKDEYRPAEWTPPTLPAGSLVRAYVGIDGGSTSTKGVLLDAEATVIARAYQLSNGNPIEDTMQILAALEARIIAQGCRLEVLGVGTTGYAKDVLKDVLGADVALVETVAHAQAGLAFYPDTDVIVDVGGQDIKIIILKNGQVKDFRLNTQCSAGNGYFLQATAQTLGYSVEEFADTAFTAERMPSFGYGCAVFMQSDIVDFQRQGWAPAEIMAGLCDVLPRNIWLYVSQIPNLPRLGRTFVLQGGTQHNLAAVKAQADFIRARFRGGPTEPEVIVHRFCGEAGAIGCAVEARRRHLESPGATRFIGFERARSIAYRTTRSEATRCYFCKNKCLRTFIDVQTGAATTAAAPWLPLGDLKRASKVPLASGEQRLIIATCEKGTVEDVDEMRQIKSGLETVRRAHPNFAEIAAREAFRPADVACVADPPPRLGWGRRRHADIMQRRRGIRIGMPRVLNMYSLGPWFTAYFQALGLSPGHLAWSDPTSPELYREGAKRGAIDPCFPSKIAIPHVHDLLTHKHSAREPLRYIFFPMIDSLPTFLDGVVDSRACPTVTATPEAVKAAFTKESDLFAAAGLTFLDTFLNFAEPALLARQMYGQFGGPLELSRGENERACRTAWDHHAAFWARLREDADRVLEALEREDRVGVVLLSRPYHHDPGVCHEIPAELPKLGFPVFTSDVLPRTPARLAQLFGDEVHRAELASGLSVDDVWKNAYSENTNRKVWAAKYTARHPNLVALELSSFKCGHDAPIYSVVEEIIETSGTPYFAFKDIDENKPAGSIRIRVETMAYFLGRYREQLVARGRTMREIDARLQALEATLRG